MLGQTGRDLERALRRVWIGGTLERCAHDRRLFEGLLHVHAELGQVEEELELRLWLRVGARRAEHHVGLTVLQRQRRIDRLPHALAWFQHVDVVFVEPVVRHAVVQHEAGAVHHVAAAEQA